MARYLNVTGDAAFVTPGAVPAALFGVLSAKSPSQFGTYYYDRLAIYDQVALVARSPRPGRLELCPGVGTGPNGGPDAVRVRLAAGRGVSDRGTTMRTGEDLATTSRSS